MCFVVLMVAACSFDSTGLQSEGPPGGTTTGEGPGPATMTTTTEVEPTPTEPTTTTNPVDPSSTTMTEPPPPTCGDGELDEGEECDDGNDADDDECTSACKAAVCGDGFVGPGEACDDGNDDDTDACVSGCVMAGCGDGLVQAGVEECDDGNTDDNDTCTQTCKPVGCEDGVENAGESDVDCGGPCPDCQLGQGCGSDDDCAAGTCLGGVCEIVEDCQELKEKHPDLPSGTYTIDPDKEGDGAAFAVYCEQEVEGGGWTLVLKARGDKSTFRYGDELWENEETFQEDPDLSRDETKLASWNSVSAGEVLLGLEAPIKNNGDLAFEYLVLPAGASSARALFSGSYKATTLGEDAWRATVPGSSMQNFCNREGFNVRGDTQNSADYARIRIGIIANENNDCVTPNSYIGVGGGFTGANCLSGSDNTTGNRAGCGADMGNKDIDAFAAVFVR